MAEEFNLKDYRKRMDGAITSLKTEFSGLRTGRANAALLDNITVSAYGCLLYTSPSPRDKRQSRMPSSA